MDGNKKRVICIKCVKRFFPFEKRLTTSCAVTASNSKKSEDKVVLYVVYARKKISQGNNSPRLMCSWYGWISVTPIDTSRAVSLPVGRHLGGWLAMTLVATITIINNIIIPPPCFYFSHRGGAPIKKLILQKLTGAPKNLRTTWFNPHYSLNVATNIGREFWKIIDKYFSWKQPTPNYKQTNSEYRLQVTPKYGGTTTECLKNQMAKIVLPKPRPRNATV